MFWTKNIDVYGPNRFMTFVDRVLFLRDSLDIHRFCLSCAGQSDFNRIDGWICTAARRNVFELDFHLCIDKPRYTFEFPQSIFMCKTLVVLKLMSNCTIYSPPTSGCFPSLKFLDIYLTYPQDNSVENLIPFCPVLVAIDGTLRSIHACVYFNFNISAPKLKKLRISLTIGSPTEPYNVFINAPKLETIDLSQNTMATFSIENVKSLVQANIVLEACREK